MERGDGEEIYERGGERGREERVIEERESGDGGERAEGGEELREG